jgi:uncharacterized phage protein (TIGR02218 family)
VTFEAYETADGSPVELVTFKNGSLVFRYTNAVFPFSIGASTYNPLAYKRSRFAQSKDSDDNNITLTAAGDMEVAQLFNGIMTSNITTVTIERIHRDDADEQVQVAWRGRVVAINHKNAMVDLLLQPITHGGESTPRDVFSALCNAFLFDTPGCRLLRADWSFNGTIDGISVDGMDITINGARVQAAALDTAQGGPTGPLTSGELDLYWQGGYLQLLNGEVRDVVEGNIAGDPDVVRLDQPFRAIATSDLVTLYAGCDLTRQTCHKKFDNVLNFQGYPDIPEIDPANTEMPPGTRTSGSKFAGPQ